MRLHVWIVLASLSLGACNVGPDFVRPQSGLSESWQLPENSDVRSEAIPAAVDPRWWDSFGDPRLSSLIERAANENLDVRSAFSRLEQSRAARGAIAAGQSPDLSAGAGYSRARNSQQV
jgi:outer membrane protein TolC